MTRIGIMAVLLAVIGVLLFGWGYRRGIASVEVRDSVSVQLRPLPSVTVTVREPWPVAVREPADTVWVTLPADTAAIVADYLRMREYHLDFSSDTTGRYTVDAVVGQNRLLEITPTIEPLIREVTHTRTQVVTHSPRFAVTAGVGVAYTPRGLQPTAGVQVGVVLWSR